MKLIIGNKNYSSWSLRAWLLLMENDLQFEEIAISLSVPETAVNIAQYTNAGKVPVLHDRDIVIWDSLAICEYISEQYLGGLGWPTNPLQRAEARSCCAEMHSGFFSLRELMPMNCRAEKRTVDTVADLQKDIDRIDALWTELRTKYRDNGPFLFGTFSIADCMFAPVVFRFRTYGVKVSSLSREYCKTMLSHEYMVLWLEKAKTEPERIDIAEVGT